MLVKRITLVLLIIFNYTFLHSQDTLIIINNYKIKAGIKLTAEKCNYGFNSEGGYQLYSGGFQFIKRVKQSRASIESGLYLFPTAYPYTKIYKIIDNFGNTTTKSFVFNVEYYYLAIPLNCRFDTRSIYVSGGLFFNNLFFRYGEYLNYTDSIDNYQTDRKFNWGLNLTFGLEKHISNRVNIFVEGKYVYTVSSFKTDGNFIAKW